MPPRAVVLRVEGEPDSRLTPPPAATIPCACAHGRRAPVVEASGSVWLVCNCCGGAEVIPRRRPTATERAAGDLGLSGFKRRVASHRPAPFRPKRRNVIVTPGTARMSWREFFALLAR